MPTTRRILLKAAGAAAASVASFHINAQSTQSAEPGIDRATRTVTVGAFTPVTGPVPFYATLTHAADACLRHVSETGAMDGWKIRFVTYDDGYEPARSVAVTRRLVEEDKVFSLVASVGTAQNVAVIPYAREVGLPMLGPIGGSPALFGEKLVFPLLPDYGWSAASNVDFARNVLKHDRIALLWENDELGRSALRGFDTYMKSAGLAAVESIPFEVRSTDFSAHMRRIGNARAQVVVLFGSNANLAAALKSAERLGVQTKWMAPFFTADPITQKLAGPLLEGTYFSSWLLPVSSDEPDVAAYRTAVAKYYPNDPIGVFGLNGWSNAALFVAGFRMLLASGKPLTRENLVAVMETMNNATVGGAKQVSFKSGDHRGARQEAILQASGDGFKMVQDFRPYPASVFNAALT
ncbi:MAG: ABC transporter substrate-binding protein [Pseudomonadota bacterium]